MFPCRFPQSNQPLSIEAPFEPRLTCTRSTQSDRPIYHSVGRGIDLFKVFRQEDQSAVEIAVADVSRRNSKMSSSAHAMMITLLGAHPSNGPTISLAFRSACVSAQSCGSFETGTQTSAMKSWVRLLGHWNANPSLVCTHQSSTPVHPRPTPTCSNARSF